MGPGEMAALLGGQAPARTSPYGTTRLLGSLKGGPPAEIKKKYVNTPIQLKDTV